MPNASSMTVDVHVDTDHLSQTLHLDAYEGLTSSPKVLPPKWFYDDRGSRLFDEITRLPEYYPTRRERAILEARAVEVAELTGAHTLVELGSGTSEKTRVLLHALRDVGTLQRFIPFDVSEQTLREAASAVDDELPGIDVHGVVGDFEHHLDQIPNGNHRLVAFLGGTIGNFEPVERAEFFSELGKDLHPGDALLLGADLAKDVDRLVAAYDDERGVTAEFNRNVLAVLNSELGADFDLDAFEHVVRWNAAEERIEMWLRSTTDQAVKLPAIDLVAEFTAGEEMRTEVSAKFRRQGLEAELAAARLRMVRWWTDPSGDFALSLSVPAP